MRVCVRAWAWAVASAHQVGGELLAPLDEDDVAEAQVSPAAGDKGAVAQDARPPVVHPPVDLVPPVVLHRLAQHAEPDNCSERQDGGVPACGREVGRKLQDGDEEKVEVGQPAELRIQRARHERQDWHVLCRAEDVARAAAGCLAIVLPGRGGQVAAPRHDGARCRLPRRRPPRRRAARHPRATTPPWQRRGAVVGASLRALVPQVLCVVWHMGPMSTKHPGGRGSYCNGRWAAVSHDCIGGLR